MYIMYKQDLCQTLHLQAPCVDHVISGAEHT